MREDLLNDVGRGLLATGGRDSALAGSGSGMVEISPVFDSEPSDDPADGDGARPLARSIPSSSGPMSLSLEKSGRGICNWGLENSSGSTVMR